MSVSKKLVAAISAAAVAGVAFIATPALAEDGGAQSGVVVEEEAAPVETTETPAPVVEDSVPSQAPAAPDGTATADEPSDPVVEPSAEPTDPEDEKLVEPFTFFVFPVPGPFNDDVQVSQNWGTVIFDSNDAWSRGENPLIITVSAAPGYRLQPDQKTVWEFWDEPDTITVPSFSLPSEVDNTTWEPTLPDGVTIDTDSGWKDGTRTIIVVPKDGYVFTDGQQTSFTVKVKEKPAPVDPVDPVEPVDPVTPVEPSTPAAPSQGDGKTGESQKPPVEEAATLSSSRGVSANTGLEDSGKTPLFAGLGATLVAALGGAAWLRRRS